MPTSRRSRRYKENEMRPHKLRRIGHPALAALVVIACAHTQSGSLDVAVKQNEEWRRGRTSIYMNDFGELAHYRAANAKLPPPAAGENRVVFLGDSITDAWVLPESFPGKPYVNRGIGGQTTAQLLVRFHQDVIALHPKVVVILAGTNDIAGNTGPTTLEDIQANFTSMVELARERHPRRAVVGAAGPQLHTRLRADVPVAPARADRRAQQVAAGLRGCNRQRLPRLRHRDVRRERPAQAGARARRPPPDQGRLRHHGAARRAGHRQGARRRRVARAYFEKLLTILSILPAVFRPSTRMIGRARPAGMVAALGLGLAASAVVAAAEAAPRERLLADAGWRFHLGDEWGIGEKLAKAGSGRGPASIDFSDVAWRKVELPHDWAVELPFDPKADGAHGFKAIGEGFPQNSVGWYRRTFELPVADAGRRLWLEFDGVFRDSTVYVNGWFVGRHESGYGSFRYDISNVVNPGGRNVVAVRVDASQFEGWFYEGAGIYRHVWLVKTAPLAIAPDGIFVFSRFPNNVPAKVAEIHVETRI